MQQLTVRFLGIHFCIIFFPPVPYISYVPSCVLTIFRYLRALYFSSMFPSFNPFSFIAPLFLYYCLFALSCFHLSFIFPLFFFPFPFFHLLLLFFCIIVCSLFLFPSLFFCAGWYFCSRIRSRLLF